MEIFIAVLLSNPELDFMPTIKVLPSTEVIEGDSMHITCGVTGKNYSSPLLSLSKGSRLFPSPERKNPEYKAVVMAADSGGYECSARVNSVEKNVYANLTVKGEKPLGERIDVNFMSLLALIFSHINLKHTKSVFRTIFQSSFPYRC